MRPEPMMPIFRGLGTSAATAAKANARAKPAASAANVRRVMEISLAVGGNSAAAVLVVHALQALLARVGVDHLAAFGGGPFALRRVASRSASGERRAKQGPREGGDGDPQHRFILSRNAGPA